MKKKMILFFVIYIAIDIVATLVYQLNSGLSWSNHLLYERATIATFLIVGTPVMIIHFKQTGWRPSYLK